NVRKTTVIPKSSLVVGTMTYVWVMTGQSMFERRVVETGIENKKQVEILSGIKPGEKVVSYGGYMLNSEFIIRQGNTMGGMKM
ncbi:MAG: efflux RND transporter periplasmic adaptor subunit, partial [Cytophagaceae bacterium]|nr:efflux RND transporter periplasmic adaptor subunit [Cytophagaceae bacterium]